MSPEAPGVLNAPCCATCGPTGLRRSALPPEQGAIRASSRYSSITASEWSLPENGSPGCPIRAPREPGNGFAWGKIVFSGIGSNQALAMRPPGPAQAPAEGAGLAFGHRAGLASRGQAACSGQSSNRGVLVFTQQALLTRLAERTDNRPIIGPYPGQLPPPGRRDRLKPLRKASLTYKRARSLRPLGELGPAWVPSRSRSEPALLPSVPLEGDSPPQGQ